MTEQRLCSALSSVGVSQAQQVVAAPVLLHYLKELQRGNPRFGLISREDAGDEDRLLNRHILDSAAVSATVAPLLEGRQRIYDLGSGAGLPGIPLAAVLASHDRSPVETVLVERRSKRTAFLLGLVPGLMRRAREAATTSANRGEQQRTVLQLRVLEADATRLQDREGERLSGCVVVFRAYRQTTAELLRDLSATFPPGTPVCALKGRWETVEQEIRILEASAQAESVAAERVSVPGVAAERSVLTWVTR